MRVLVLLAVGLVLLGLAPLPAEATATLTTVSVTAPTRFQGRVETWTFEFTTAHAVPARGALDLHFPAGFATSTGSASLCDVVAPATVGSESATVVSGTEVACVLGEGDTIAAGAVVQVTVSRVQNPVGAGNFTPFSATTQDPDGNPIDASAALRVEILAEALPDVVVTAPLQRTGLVETHALSFTAVSAVPGNGSVFVVVPVGYTPSTGGNTTCDVTSPTTVASESTRVNGRQVACTLGPSDTIAPGAAVRFTLTFLRNPTVAGPSRPFVVETRGADGRTLDSNKLDVETVVASPLGAVVLSAATDRAGAAGNVSLSFAVVNAVAGRGDLRIVFPVGYAPSSGGATRCDVTAPTSAAAETTLVSGSEVLCKLASTDSIAAGAAVALSITHVANPPSARTTGAFTIQARDPNGAVQDANTTIRLTVVANTLTRVSASAPQQKVGATETWAFRFRPTSAVEARGDVHLRFPAGFQLSDGAASGCAVGTPGGVTTSATVASSSEITCTVLTGRLPGGADAVLNVTNVRNPTAAGATAAFTIEARDASDALQDTFTGANATIVVAPLPGLQATAPARTTGTVENQTFVFRTTKNVPAGGDVHIVFPAGFVVASGAASACRFQAPANASAATAVLGGSNDVACRLPANVSVPASTAVTVLVTKVREPTSSGTTGAFLVETRTSAGVLLEQNATVRAAVQAHAFLAGPVRTGPAPVARAVGDHRFNVTLANAWEATGSLVVAVPRGYAFDASGPGSTKASFVAGGSGGFAPAVFENGTATFVRAGGSAIPAGSVVAVRVTAVRNPNATRDGGSFTLTTRDAGGNDHDKGAVGGPAIQAAPAASPSARASTPGPASSRSATSSTRVPTTSPGRSPGPDALALLLASGAALFVAGRRRP